MADDKAPETVTCLRGELVKKESGWVMLTVPNQLLRGLQSALDDKDAVLPNLDGDDLFGHISVFRPEELEELDKDISEIGEHFSYQLGPVQKVDPAGWEAVDTCYFVKVNSPELEDLREKYGLSRLPNKGKFNFHITFAVSPSAVKKAAATLSTIELRQPTLMDVSKLQIGSRSKRDRFGPKRYERADPHSPIIVDKRGRIIDGRHRVAKVQDNGGQTIAAYVASAAEAKKLRNQKIASELELWQKEASLVTQEMNALLPLVPAMMHEASYGNDIYWNPNEGLITYGKTARAGAIPLLTTEGSTKFADAARLRDVPLNQMLVGSLLGGAVGYGGGRLAEAFIPDRYLPRGELRKRTALLGAGLGAAPGALLGMSAAKNLRQVDPSNYYFESLGKAFTTPLQDTPAPDGVYPAQKLGKLLKAGVAVLSCGKKLRGDHEIYEKFVKESAAESGIFGARSIPVDAFNRVIWNDVRSGMTAARNPYGTKSHWGDNNQPFSTPPIVGATVVGLMNGVQALAGGSPYISPKHIAQGLVSAGVGAITATAVGKTLGALGGLSPAAQNGLQQAGIFGGLMTGVVNALRNGTN